MSQTHRVPQAPRARAEAKAGAGALRLRSKSWRWRGSGGCGDAQWPWVERGTTDSEWTGGLRTPAALRPGKSRGVAGMRPHTMTSSLHGVSGAYAIRMYLKRNVVPRTRRGRTPMGPERLGGLYCLFKQQLPCELTVAARSNQAHRSPVSFQHRGGGSKEGSAHPAASLKRALARILSRATWSHCWHRCLTCHLAKGQPALDCPAWRRCQAYLYL